MSVKEVQIELYDKRQRSTTTLYVGQLAENKFRMTENDPFNCTLTLGTEFETRINKEGKHEIIRITKKSEFITRRFFLSPKHTRSEYMVLGDELVKHGGFWQVDFGGILTVNIPRDFKYDVDEIMKTLGLQLSEIKD